MAGFFDSFDPRLGPQAAIPRSLEEEAAVRQGQIPGVGTTPADEEAARQQALANLGDARQAPTMAPMPPSALMPPATGRTGSPFIARKTFTPPTPQQVGQQPGQFSERPPEPQRGEMPDFGARPEGEDMQERFLGLQMLRMGRNAPAWMTQQFRDIEQAKRARIAAQANYLADMNKQQYRADLQRRNQFDRIHSGEVQGALDRSLNARLQGAQLEQARQIANANFQLQSQQIDQQKAANRIAQAQQNIQNIAKVKEKYAPELDQLGATLADYNDMRQLINKASQRLGGGKINLTNALAALGDDESQRLQKMFANLQGKVAQAAKGQGQISNFERELYAKMSGDVGMTPGAVLDDLGGAVDEVLQKINRNVEIMDSLAPQASVVIDPETGEATRVVGVGTAAKRDLHDIILETVVQNEMASEARDQSEFELRRQADLQRRAMRY